MREREYISSAEALRWLCARRPYRPIKEAICSVATGITATGGGLAAFTIMQSLSSHGDILTYANYIASGIPITYGLYKLSRGIVSLVAHLLPHISDGSVWCINGKYTDNPSMLDRISGQRVHPVDDITELNSLDDQVLLNGVTLRSRQFETEVEKKIGKGYVNRTVSRPPEKVLKDLVGYPFGRHYSAFIQGRFHGRNIWAGTKKRPLILSLADTPEGRALYLRGHVNKIPRIDLEEIGYAFPR